MSRTFCCDVPVSNDVLACGLRLTAAWPLAELLFAATHGARRPWRHLADMRQCGANVRFRGWTWLPQCRAIASLSSPTYAGLYQPPRKRPRWPHPHPPPQTGPAYAYTGGARIDRIFMETTTGGGATMTGRRQPRTRMVAAAVPYAYGRAVPYAYGGTSCS